MGSNHQQNHDGGLITYEKPPQCIVVMVPFPAHGHLNQFMQFSCLITSYKIAVHYAASAIHNHQARARVNALNPIDVAKVHFHDLPVQPFKSLRPDPNSPDKFPMHLLPAFNAMFTMSKPLADYVRALSFKAKRIVIIHDTYNAASVQDIGSIANVELYVFNCVSASFMSRLIWEQANEPFPLNSKGLPPVLGVLADELQEFVKKQAEPLSYRAGDIHNTCRLIEAPYLDLMESEKIAGKKKSWAIGPIFPPKLVSTQEPEKIHECLEWLDKQEQNSVIYVSFGTTVSLSNEETRELAQGIEASKQKFLWVLRDADKTDIFDGEVRRVELPHDFEERMKGVGIIVRDWAPQPEILAHPSIGGFLSHCGWNSILESIMMGVPIAAYPMHFDQPANTFLITEQLKIGIVTREWTRMHELVKAPLIEAAVRKLMASNEGDEIRKRAQELSASIRQAIGEGGVSRRELDSFIAHISREDH